jgi:hypothetical protein
MRNSIEKIKLKEVYRLLKEWVRSQDIHNTPDSLLLKNEKYYGKVDRDKIEKDYTDSEIALREFVDENSWIEK